MCHPKPNIGDKLRPQCRQMGFTLVEVAIVVAIVGLLLGGAIMTLTAQNDIKNLAETRATLERTRNALLGFAVAQGRLPCPATANGFEDPVTPPSGAPQPPNPCANNFSGFVPAATLGLTPTDADNLLVDAWGQPIRYAVTRANGDAFTTPDGMRDAGITALASDLQICEATAITCSTPPPDDDILTKVAVVVLISSGKNQTFEDSAENVGNDNFFVYRLPSNNADDLIFWMSPFELYNRMIAAGAL